MSSLSLIRYSLMIQLIVSFLASFLALIWGTETAWSLLLGAAIFIVPNVYFTHYAFRYRFRKDGIDLSEWIYRSLMWGQMGKLSLATLGFALVFRFVDQLDVAGLFAGYMAMIFTQWWLGHKIATDASEAEAKR